MVKHSSLYLLYRFEKSKCKALFQLFCKKFRRQNSGGTRSDAAAVEARVITHVGNPVKKKENPHKGD